MSGSCDMLMVDLCHFSNGGTMAWTGCRRFEIAVWARTVSAQLRVFGSGTRVLRNVI
jgi:hypothetical protein